MSVKAKEHSRLSEEEKNYIKFFEYWHEIDIVKAHTSKEHDEIFGSSPYRFQIVDVMAIGIEDIYPGKGKRLRHALTGKEIMELIAEHHNNTISKSNLYFHINALIEAGIVNEVGTVAVGKRFTSYYGRTAKAFLTVKTGKDIHPIIYKDYFHDIIKKLNPEISQDEINATVNKLKPLTNYDDHVFADWIEEYQKLIFDAEIDMRYLANFASILHRYNPLSGEGITELGKLLKVEKIHEADRDVPELNEPEKSNFIELTQQDMFSYWQKLPPVRLFSNNVYKNVFDHTQSKQKESVILRMLVITVLKEGRIEENPDTGRTEQRNLMTASEILDDLGIYSKKYKKNIDTSKIKPSALYFHLDKLEKHGLINAVGYITHGRKRTTYYGRTAKYYTYNEQISKEDTYPVLRSEGLKELVLRLDRDVTKSEYESTIEDVAKINDYDPLSLALWLKTTKVDIDDIKVETDNDELRNVDLVEIATILGICLRYTPEVIEGLHKLANWLKFPQAE